MVMWAERLEKNQFCPSGHPFQTRFWGELKKFNGWTPYYLRFHRDSGTQDHISYDVLLLVKQIVPGFTLGYVPMGPGMPVSSETLRTLAKTASILITHLFTIRFDLPWTTGTVSHDLTGMKKKSFAVQPERTVQINVTQEKKELYHALRKRARRQISRSEMEGVSVSVVHKNITFEQIDEFYQLYLTTSERDHFQPRSKDYITHLLTRVNEDDGSVFLMQAYISHEGKKRLAAGIIVLTHGKEAIYLIGASLRESWLHCSPSYLLQWETMCFLPTIGIEVYDLFGISSTASDGHLQSLNQFKLAFSKSVIERPGMYDVVLKPIPYTLFSLAEGYRMRKFRHS